MSSFTQYIPKPSRYALAQPDINILMMGETGVGKSTFINAFANYLVYNTLKQAITGEMQVLIPSTFYMTNPDTFESQLILIGNPSNDEKCEEVGQSSTQICQSYVFPIGNRLLRLIDAPGIGDVRGIEQDAKNCDHILSYVSHYEHLNGICILLKPNTERLTVGFRFCIKELLTHLHINAKDNLMFVFTNGRSTFYRPGSTTPLLRSLLNELNNKWNVEIPFSTGNTFMFDSEAFRFLATHKNGLKFSSEETDAFCKSWEISVNEFNRLLQCIVKCDTHAVRDSLSINAAQQLIRILTRPIGEIARLIQENIQLAQKYKKDAEMDPLTLGLKRMPQKSGKVVRLDCPRTVCTRQRCIQISEVDGQRQVNYIAKCHPECYLRDVERECVGHSTLQYCHAMNKVTGQCNLCGCHWNRHMHVTYEYQTSITSITIDGSSSRSSLAAVDKHITNLRQEETYILDTCNKLSQFLQQNLITPYNDDILEYIRYFIREEEMKRSAGANNEAVIQGLRNMIEGYERERKLFQESLKRTTDAASNSTNNGFGPEDILGLAAKLYKLPINGASIRQQVEGLEQTQLQTNRKREHFVQVPLNANSSTIMQQLINIVDQN